MPSGGCFEGDLNKRLTKRVAPVFLELFATFNKLRHD